MTTDKNKKCTCKAKKNPHFKLEFAEELSLPARLRPSKTGSVAQNTAKPVSKH